MTAFLCSLFFISLIVLNLSKRIDLSKPLPGALYMLLMPHLPLFLVYLSAQLPTGGFRMAGAPLAIACAVLFHLYSTIRLHILPFRHNESGSVRVGIAYGGCLLLRLGAAGTILQLFFYVLCYIASPASEIEPFAPFLITTNHYWLVFDLIYTFVFIFLFLANGALRILCCCYRLGVMKRILIWLWMWIPGVNLLLLRTLSRAAKDEYDITLERRLRETLRVGSNTCATRYPLILVHGIGFRDLKYFNYWGRMPRLLKENGAVIYYGHQNAWGTIEENAARIAETIDLALGETGADKVNIIAHSKGGLDSRFLISHLGYADKVASLTTMSTPHHGSELIDFLNTLPDGLYRFLAGCFDKSFSKFGDEQPDCYHASKQLAPAYCSSFNENTPDSPLVYYQSYTSVMNGMFSDSLLSIPYFFMRVLSHEQNDGLVTVSSSKWGEFKEVFQNRKKRGLSHGDMIDLKREDIKGFDILEKYIQIVEELKKQGF